MKNSTYVIDLLNKSNNSSESSSRGNTCSEIPRIRYFTEIKKICFCRLICLLTFFHRCDDGVCWIHQTIFVIAASAIKTTQKYVNIYN